MQIFGGKLLARVRAETRRNIYGKSGALGYKGELLTIADSVTMRVGWNSFYENDECFIRAESLHKIIAISTVFSPQKEVRGQEGRSPKIYLFQ